jgi:sugar O-acyltransferase (sialic acid O-acetyltransferase NeuD family)
MRDLAIYGAGGLGRELFCMIDAVNKSLLVDDKYHFIGFFDDGKTAGTEISHFGKVLGGMDAVNAWEKPLCVVIAVGSPASRFAISSRIVNDLVEFPNFIHPSFYVSDPETFVIGKGNVIVSHCTATVNITIGDFNLFNGSVSMGHDDVIGNCNVIMPSTRISGEVKMGDRNLIGVGSIIIQQIKIGTGVTLGAGAVLMTKPKDNSTYIGNPAKIFRF